MKKILLLFAFVGVFGLVQATAQTCCSKKAKTTSTTCKDSNADVMKAAVKLASLDESIEKKVCDESGKVSFVKKDVCSVSGKVSYTDVEYNAAAKKFVNVSPSGKNVVKKEASAVKTSTTTKTSSCGSKAPTPFGCSKKAGACCSGSKSTSTEK
ncbi:MAG: hypothetical protein GY705_26505 [Bacteroidetes bacterium]|nr:hypothetical protein [Bacteroidota bacterium]